MTDLTEAVELAARALYAQQWPGKDFDALTPLEQLNWRETVAPVVAAVAPLITEAAKAEARREYAAELAKRLRGVEQPTVFSFGQDRPWRILEAIRRRELGLSPETHICMGAIQTFASVSTWSPWREVPNA